MMRPNSTVDTPSEREEIEALLAWYVSGKLDVQQRARVDRYLEAHPDVASSMGLGYEPGSVPLSGTTPITADPYEAFDGRRARNAATSLPNAREAAHPRLYDRVTDGFGRLRPTQIAFAAAAAALVIIALSTVIAMLILQRPVPALALRPTLAPSIDETAMPVSSHSPGIELLIGFTPTASVRDVTALLGSLGAQVIEGPQRGLYRVRVPSRTSEDNGRKEILAALRTSRLVAIVLPPS